MNISDNFSNHYQPVIDDIYDCVDRIVFNAFFIQGHIAGGFRNWWRLLYGNDDKLNDTQLMRLAGRMSRRIKAYTKAHNIPLIYCKNKIRKEDIAKEYMPSQPNKYGLFLVLVNRAPDILWHIQRGENDQITHIVKKNPNPYINHYFFHIMDKQWGVLVQSKLDKRKN